MADLSNILAMLGIGNAPTPGQAQTAAQAFPGTTPSQFQSVAGAQPNAPAPTDTAQSGITNFLTNPLVQGAANAYFTAAAAPRHTTMLGRIAEGGLAGMQTLAQEDKEHQLIDPLLKSNLAQSQAQTGLMQRQLAPISPDILSKIDAYKAVAQQQAQSAGTPQEKSIAQRDASMLDMIEAQAKAGVITPEDVDKFLMSHDQAKQMMELYKGMGALQNAQIMPYLLQQLGINVPGMASGAPLPMPGGAGPTGAPPTGAPPSGGASPVPGLPFTPAFETTMPDGKPAYYNSAEKKWYHDGGSGWTAIP